LLAVKEPSCPALPCLAKRARSATAIEAPPALSHPRGLFAISCCTPQFAPPLSPHNDGLQACPCDLAFGGSLELPSRSSWHLLCMRSCRFLFLSPYRAFCFPCDSDIASLLSSSSSVSAQSATSTGLRTLQPSACISVQASSTHT
jgi:hypothetical protein